MSLKNALNQISSSASSSRVSSLPAFLPSPFPPSSSFSGHGGMINQLLTFGNYVFSSSYDRTARCWELDTGDYLREFKGHSHAVIPMLFIEKKTDPPPKEKSPTPPPGGQDTCYWVLKKKSTPKPVIQSNFWIFCWAKTMLLSLGTRQIIFETTMGIYLAIMLEVPK